MNEVIKDKDIIFNLAAQVSYIDSATMPFEDLDVDCRGQLIILEACRKYNKNVKIIFASSRMVLGKILTNTVSEDHPTNPLSFYGIHKLTAEKYHLMYYRDHGIRSVILRITNPFGERQQIKHSKYSLPGWFMRLAMEGKTIKIFGDGNQLRDYIYGTDIANAFIFAAISDNTDGQIYNCGYGESLHFKDMVNLIVKTVGSGNIKFVPWPEDYERIETGDCKTDVSKLISDTGWKPEITVEGGVKRMVEYYKEHKDKYI
jgi:UDP-glucose 4-epimerase